MYVCVAGEAALHRKGVMQSTANVQQTKSISVSSVVEIIFNYIEYHPVRSLLAWLVLVSGVRLALATSHDGYLGVDGGAYLLSLNSYWGGDTTNASFERPPLAPAYLLLPFMAIIKGSLGFNTYMAVFSMSLIPSFFFLSRKILGVRFAAIATVGISLDWALSEMFVTGVVPITGFGFMALLLYGMMGLAEENTWKYRLIIIGSIPMIAFTNQTALGLSLVTVPIAWLMLDKKLPMLMMLSVGAAASLTALPWYIDVLPTQPRVSYDGPLIYLNYWWSSQWLQLLFAITVAYSIFYIFRSEKIGARRNERLIATLLIVHGILNVFLSNDEAIMNIFYRSSYWISVPFVIGCAILLKEANARYLAPNFMRIRYPILSLLAVIALVALGSYGSIFQFYGQAYYSNLAGRDVLNALDSIPADEITRVGTNAESRGFYIAALTKKPVVWVQSATPAESYIEQEARARCELGWREDCSGTGYVSHWLIDTTETQQIKALLSMAPNPEDAFGNLGEHAPWLERTFVQNNVEVWTYVTEETEK